MTFSLHDNFASCSDYEKRIRKFVPYYDEMLDCIISCLPSLNSNHRILELGCGTGNLSEKLIQERKCRCLTAIDIVEEMLVICRRRLAFYSGNYEILKADMIKFSRLEIYDYTVSNLALHYPETAKLKKSVLKNVFRSLKNNGVFIFSVMLHSECQNLVSLIWSDWEKDVYKKGTSPEEINDWYEKNHRLDFPATPHMWLDWLKKIGFRHGDLIWRKNIFGVFWSVK